MTREEIVAWCEEAGRMADQAGSRPLTEKQRKRVEEIRRRYHEETEQK
jgi:hypothetical protein